MTLISPQMPFGHVTFCDDIRQEDNGKHLLIGVYNAVMYVPKIPFGAPKFCVRIRYVERVETVGKPLQFRIFLPGAKPDSPVLVWDAPKEHRLSLSEEVTQERLKHIRELSGEGWEAPDLNYVTIHNLVLSPLIITQEGPVRVRAFSGNDEIKLGALMVTVRPPDEISSGAA
jgi:hypothetical protein